MIEPRLITRRDFLGNSVLVGVQLSAFGLLLGTRVSRAATPLDSNENPAMGFTPNVFVHISPTGEVTIVCHRSEMGQGIRSSMPVLIADELGVDMKQVKVVQGDGDKKYGDQNTDGSTSIRNGYENMRLMGATARTMLITAAADLWKVSPASCKTEHGFVLHHDTGRKTSFGSLAEAAAKLPVPKKEDVTYRPTSELKNVGTNLPLLDAPAYVTGTAAYGADISIPGMLIAVIARPPVVGGKIKSYNVDKALKVPGVKKVVEMPPATLPYAFQAWGGLAVVADNTWAALKGRAQLEIEWDEGANASYNSDEFRKELSLSVSKPGKVIRKTGDVEKTLANASKRVEAEYHVPHLPHVPMEPIACIAHIHDGRCDIWASTQNPQAAQKEAARVLGMPEEKIHVHVTFLGGAFGRKSKADFISEATFLAKKMDAPVRVQWSREDDIQQDYYNTVSTQLLTAGLDEHGKVTAWRHRTAFPPIGSIFSASDDQPDAGDLQQGVLDLPLSIPNVQGESCKAPAHVRIGWLRSVYNIFHSFATNSFMDELAHTQGKDMRETMLELIGPPRLASLEELGIPALKNYGSPLEKHPVDAGRLRHVIEEVTRISHWKGHKAEGRTLGLAAHRSFLSYVAAVVSMKKHPDGKVYVDEVWTVIDAGKIINRDRVRSQMEGAVLFGMSIAYYGAITMKDGKTEQSNFDTLKLVRMKDAPRKIHVEIVESELAPGGVGEPGVPPVAPAIINAVFALTGQRVRTLPLSSTGLV